MSDVPVVVAAAVITALLRILPLVLRQPEPVALKDPSPVTSDLAVLPLAVLTALVVPGALSVDGNNALVGLVAAIVAAGMVVLWRDVKTYVVIGAAVAAALATHVLTR